MADNFMVSSKVVFSDEFLSLPIASRDLYFYLLANADNKGLVNNARSVVRQCRATNNDFNALIPKFVKPHELKTKRISMLMTPSLFDDIKAEAERAGISVNELINQVLETVLQDRTKGRDYLQDFDCFEIVHWEFHKFSESDVKGRRTYEYKVWKDTVKSRDGNKCVMCGSTRRLEVHHIKPFAEFPEFRTDPNNGITLCRNCHSLYHAIERKKKKMGVD